MFAWSQLEFSAIPAVSLKGVWHEIFDFSFFSWISVPRAPEYSIRIIRLFSKIRRDNREWMFISGVNDTGEKLLGGDNDTAVKFIGGVVDTGD